MFSKISFTTIALTCGIFAISTPASALVGMGIKAGVGFSSVSTNPSADNDSGRGIVGGVSMDIGLGLVSFVVDALYAKRGFGDGAGSVSLNTLHLPAQVKFSLLPGLFTSAGAYYSTGIGDTDGYTGGGLKTTDYGAVVGVGAALPLGVTTASLELRYNIGLANIKANAAGDTSIKNRIVDVLVGLRF